MEIIHELILTVGIIVISAFSMKFNHDALIAVENMNNQVQIAFLKS